MILIRGIRGEMYARKIEKGIVDCRDVLSSILDPPVTGYEYSDYYEKNLVKAISYFSKNRSVKINDPLFLYSLLVDYYIPHIYLTYFHILNEHSLEWLDKFDEGHQFIAVNVKIDKLTQTAIGNEYFGAKMSYVDCISELKQDGFNPFQAACMCSVENLFTNKRDMELSLQIYNTLSFPLLCREQDEKFTDIENEFRIIAYDCPRIVAGLMKQIPREAIITGKSGVKYSGVLNATMNTIFKSNQCVLLDPFKSLRDILVEEQGMVTIDSKFKSINIGDVSDDYKYIGGKKECENYIKKMLASKHKDIYVTRTVLKKYKRSSLSNAVFAPGYQKVDY